MNIHVFVVDARTFKFHLEYMFAGTGATFILRILATLFQWNLPRALHGF